MDRPTIPDDLGALSAEALAALVDAVRAHYAANREGDTPNIDELRWAHEQSAALALETGRRVDAVAALAAMDDAMAPPVADPPAATPAVVEPTAPTVPAAVTDPTVPAPTLDALAAALDPTNRPPDVLPTGLGLVAAAGLPRVRMDEPVDTWDTLSSIFASVAERGPREQTLVASGRLNLGDQQVSEGNSPGRNSQIVRELMAQRDTTKRAILAAYADKDWKAAQALVATGGLCGPVDAYRGICGGRSIARPVLDALGLIGAGFDRGQINFVRNPALSSVSGALDSKTSAEDLNTATDDKDCLQLDCPTVVSAQVIAQSACLTVGTMQDMSNPEWVRAVVDTIMSAWSRATDGALLDQIKAGSLGVVAGNSATGYGAYREDFRSMSLMAGIYRSQENLDEVGEGGPILNAIFPQWILNEWRSDLAGGQFDLSELEDMDAELLAPYARIGVDITRAHSASATAPADNVFDVQTAGQLQSYPLIREVEFFAEGTWRALTAQAINFGLAGGTRVVDGTLIRTNNFMLFSEIFEVAARLCGFASWTVQLSACPNGAAAAGVTPDPDCAGASGVL